MQGAGLDVFAKEPTTESPLFELASVVVAPHLGASTAEAQDKAGVTIAEQVMLGLGGGLRALRGQRRGDRRLGDGAAVHADSPSNSGGSSSCLNDGLPDTLEIEYQGGLAGAGTDILDLSVLKGVFATATEEPVSYVNAPQLAAERGLEVRETSTVTAHDYVNLITVRGGGHSVAGTLTGTRGEPHLVMMDDHSVEVPPSPQMVVVRNDDRPGMIGVVGTVLGDADVSISSMAVGPSETGNTALMVLSTDKTVPEDALARLRDAAGISDVHTIELADA